MDDLISRQALREAMYHEAFETDSNMQRWDSGCWIRYKMFENAIESAPTIDPVRHGRWKEKMLDKFRKYEVVCSECGARYVGNYDAYDEPADFNYCPNCGAKMDGGEG